MTQPPSGPPPSPLTHSPGIPPTAGAAGPVGPNLINGATSHGVMGQKGIRHPWEMPVLWVGIALTTLAYIAWAGLIATTLVLWVTEGAETVSKPLAVRGDPAVLHPAGAGAAARPGDHLVGCER